LDETTCTTSTGTTTSTASHNPETWGAKLGDFNGFQWILGLISISILILDVFNDVRVENFNIFQLSMFFGIDFSQCGTNIPTPPRGIPCRRAPLPGSWDHLSDIGGTHLHLKFKEFKESTCISNQTIISMCQRRQNLTSLKAGCRTFLMFLVFLWT
jgi:hypothetical protein